MPGPGRVPVLSRLAADFRGLFPSVIPPVPPAPGPGVPPTPQPPGSPLRYRFYDLVSLTHLADLPATGITFGSQLLSPMSWSMQIPIASANVQALAPLASTIPGRTAMFVDYNGSLVQGGWLSTNRWQDSTQAYVVSGTELWGYFQQRLQARDYSNPAGESLAIWTANNFNPVLIAEQVIRDAQGVAFGAICGTAGNSPPGLLINVVQVGGTAPPITVTFPLVQLQTVDQIVTTLASMGYGQGFDFGVDVQYVSGIPTPVITLSYPRRGVSAEVSGLTINTETAVDFIYTMDATAQSTTLHESATTGGGIQAIVSAPSVLAAGFPTTEQNIARTYISSQAVLNACADGDLSLYAWPVPSGEVHLRINDPNAPLGSYSVGDDFRLLVSSPGANGTIHPRFPGGLDYFFRVQSWTVTVTAAGEPVSVVVFGMPPSASVVPPPLP